MLSRNELPGLPGFVCTKRLPVLQVQALTQPSIFLIEQRTSLRLSHCEHLRSCSWEQWDLSSSSLLSLRAYPLKWSATDENSDT